MATGPLLLLLIAAVPGLAGRIEATVHVTPSVDVAAVAQTSAQLRSVEVTRAERDARAAIATAKVGFLVKKAPVPVIVVAASPAPPLDEPLPRRAVWRSPAPPQGPPSFAG